MTKGVTSRNRKDKFKNLDDESENNVAEDVRDPLRHNSSVQVSFMKFLMYFYEISNLDQLIMKGMFPSKQRKLSHMIAVHGHQYLLKEMLKQIDMFSNVYVQQLGEFGRSGRHGW